MKETTTTTPLPEDTATDQDLAAEVNLLNSCLPRSPFRCPDWRWQLSLFARGHRLPANLGLDDEWLKRLIAYHENCEAMGLWPADSPAAAIDPSVHGAVHFAYNPDRLDVAEFEAWVLTGEPSDVVAAACNLPGDVVEAYEKLFFDVRERLDMRDYIRCVVLGIDAVQNLKIDDHATIWKVFAYFRGRYVLEAMLQAFSGTRFRPWPESLPTEPAERLRLIASCKLVVLASCLDTNDMKPADLAKFMDLSKRVRRRVDERKAFDSVREGITAKLDPMAILADSHHLAKSWIGTNGPDPDLADPRLEHQETVSPALIEQSDRKQTA